MVATTVTTAVVTKTATGPTTAAAIFTLFFVFLQSSNRLPIIFSMLFLPALGCGLIGYPYSSSELLKSSIVRKWEFFARNIKISGDMGCLRDEGYLLIKKEKDRKWCRRELCLKMQ
jgi:hypothetical protein